MDTVEQSDVEVQELIRSDQMYVEKTHAIYADTSIAQAHSELVARESRGTDLMKWAIALHSTVKVQDHIRSGEAINRRNVTSPTFKTGGKPKLSTGLRNELVQWSKLLGRDYVDIDCHDGRTVNAFTRYLYTGDYDIAPEISSLGSDAARQHVCWRPKNPHWERLLQSKEYGFILHAKIFLFAVHYEVAELSNLSLRKLHQAL
ncbi:uncharacterized protein CPUR_08706 [Claviceps purpurea 20.1]|uniref:Uncharacterized protein n=1 Tax=Claviceps purpurea (strain 20.1) TaxID=1111077 RepID=M1WDF4_CLAP2|nr:uncharacterized protein CPUR_08706 [Claviceps purpurea 20.1]